ncbi:MAG TPA: Gfo/Idh/MocA family oxidoreductase [Steroidobacteraceae bacterium]|nr:Gfo/Idh/MocA family oxidoreductase [Steroidobacteraceae bacterium]
MKKIRIGILGSGFSAHFHLASYRKIRSETFEIAAICARNAASRGALAAQYGIARQFDDVDAMLASAEVDALDICVPNMLHVPMILAAARHGKHVICEKPLGGYFGPANAPPDWSAEGYSREAMLEAVAAQIAAVREAVTRAGIAFCYAENWVYAPPVVKLNRLMAASGSTILRIEGEESHSGSHAPYSRRWQTAGGGSLLRLCVHPIGAALFLKQEEGRRRASQPIRPKSVTAHVARLTDIEAFKAEPRKHIVTGWQDVEDFATITLSFADNSVAQLTSTDTRLGGIRNYLSAYGSTATVTANINPNDACQAYTPDASYFASEYLVEKLETKAGWSFPAPDEDMITGYPEELRDFVGAMSEGRAPQSDLVLASDVLLTVYAGYLSAAAGRTIELAPYL